MRKYYIYLKALTFHSSKLMKKLMQEETFIHILLTGSTEKFTSFLKENLAENQYLESISNCKCKHV